MATLIKSELRAEAAHSAMRVTTAALQVAASAARMRDAAQAAAQAVRDYARAVPLRPRLLIIDDDTARLRTTRALLASECDVETVTTGTEAIALCRQQYFDVVLCDMILPCTTPGPALIAHLRTDLRGLHPHVPVIAMSTAMNDPDFQRAAERAGAHAVLPKPLGVPALYAALRRLGLMSPKEP